MDHNRKVTIAGGVVTALSTGVLFVLPAVVPLEAIRRVLFDTTGGLIYGNPFTQLPLLGGIPGALVAGYFAQDDLGTTGWETPMKVGAFASLYGLAIIWVAFVLYSVYDTTVVEGMVPPPLYLVVVIPLIYAIPLFPAYLIEGVVFGVIGDAARSAGSKGKEARS